MDINEVQKQAIEHDKGPMLVLAGPGSGKTLVITRRTMELIEHCSVKPEHILVITFTKAAAEEMKQRFLKLMGGNSCMVNFGTFHAVFFKIIKFAYSYKAENILREEERYRILQELVDKSDLNPEDEKEFIEGLGSEISKVKGERIAVDHYYSMICPEEAFQALYKAYEERIRELRKIDFDDMMVICFELLTARKDILAFWQARYEYILIDEVQDVNQIQYDIIRLLAKPEDNLFIVGDDDQSIYRFRGAKPEIMLNFEKDYPSAQRLLLPFNYRSKSNIVKGALQVVNHNRNRFVKNIQAVQEVGHEIETVAFENLKQENLRVLELIRGYYKAGIPYSDMAVLYRTNIQPRSLLGKLMEYNIPFFMKDMIPNIYEHWIAKDLFSYIHLALGSRERSYLLRIMNRPKRYLSKESLDSPLIHFPSIKKFYRDKYYVVERLEKLEYDLAQIKKLNPFAAIVYIRKGIGYDDFLKEYAQFRRMNLEELMDTLDELEENAKAFSTYEEWFSYMNQYKEELKRQIEQRKKQKEDGVAMMTYHGSKGLEYLVVLMIDANEGVTPHHRAVLEEDMEEERRMFYVAMTRAKEFLHIFWLKERYGKEMDCSRFVGELLLDVAALKKGVRVRHGSYGDGTINALENGTITIRFDHYPRAKKLDLEFCASHQLLKILS